MVSRWLEPIAWLGSLGLHAWLLLPAMREVTASSVPSGEIHGSMVAVAVAGGIPPAAIETVAREESAEVPLEVQPPPDPDHEATGDAWAAAPSPSPGSDETAPGAAPTPTPSPSAACPPPSEDAVRALDLVLDPGDHETFLDAARDLGLRLLIYPPLRPAPWVIEVPAGDPARAVRLGPGEVGSLSRRGHDLTPDPYFRDLRDRAAALVGLPATGARIVAAVPAGTDRWMLDAERAYLAALGPRGDQVRTLFGRLVAGSSGWTLEITGAR